MRIKKILGTTLTLLTLCHYVMASNGQPSFFAPVPNEVDQVTAVARAAAEVINASINSRKSQIRTNFDLIRSKLAESELNRARAIAELKNEIETLEALIYQLDKQCHENKERMKALGDQIKALEREIADIENGGNALASFVQDRTKATAVVTFITTSNQAALLDFLKRQAAAQDVEIRDARATGGINIVFRIGKITHCLSTNLQCGGKSYSLTR